MPINQLFCSLFSCPILNINLKKNRDIVKHFFAIDYFSIHKKIIYSKIEIQLPLLYLNFSKYSIENFELNVKLRSDCSQWDINDIIFKKSDVIEQNYVGRNPLK